MKINFFLFFFIAVAGCSSGQPRTLPQGYKNWYIGDFRCGVYVPPSYDATKKYPLVIYLHGHSDTTSWNFGWYHEPVALADPCIVLTPKCPASERGGWGDTHTSEISPMMKKTFEMIELIKKQYNLDEDRFYIHGTSMGAIGTFGLIQKFPGMFAAGYAVCGWADPKMAPQLSGIPFWIFHGEKDDVVPVEGSRGIYKAVVDHGGKQIRYTEFKGVKHDAWNYTDDKKIYSWLLAQKRGAVHGVPGKAPGIRGKVNAGNKILLEWDKPVNTSNADNNIWYYRIYRNNSMIGEVDSDHLNYTDSLVEKNTVYEYKITAVNYYFKESYLPLPLEIKTAPK